MTASALVAAFLDALAPPAQAGAVAETLEPLLSDLVEAASRAWPDLGLSADAFVRHVAARLGDVDDVAGALGEVRAADLWLACSCARGGEAALRRFEQRYFPDIEAVLVRMSRSTAQADEVAQRLREKLFVGTPERAAKIADYSGRGDLRNWTRAAIVRTALDLFTRGPKERLVPDEDLFAAVPDGGVDPEVDHLRRRYQTEFREALASAVGALEAKDRNLLRYAFAHGLSIDEIGALYGVHRATAARWVARARDLLARGVRRGLMDRLSIDRAEVDSIMRLVRSQLDITLERYFVSTEAAAGPKSA